MATTTESRTAGRSLPQPTDLLLVQRGSTPYRATADEVKAFMLTPATAVAIGAIKPGTNLSVDGDGTLHAAIPGALTYRGAIDPTTIAAPAGAAVGDVYLASAGGAAQSDFVAAQHERPGICPEGQRESRLSVRRAAGGVIVGRESRRAGKHQRIARVGRRVIEW